MLHILTSLKLPWRLTFILLLLFLVPVPIAWGQAATEQDSLTPADSTTAQDLTLKDATGYPVVLLELPEQVTNADNLSVTENGQEITTFKIEQQAAETATAGADNKPNKLFLVEASGLFYGERFVKVREALQTSLKTLPEGAQANIVWFSHLKDPEGLAARPLSASMSEQYEVLIRNMKNIKAWSDSNITLHLYKALYESIDMLEQESLAESTEIIVISSGRNRSSSTYTSQQCIDKAKQSGVSVSFVTRYAGYRSNVIDELKVIADQTGGHSVRFNRMAEFKPELQAVIHRVGSQAIALPLLRYTSVLEDADLSREVVVQDGENTYALTYTPAEHMPQKQGLNPLVVGGLIGGGLLLIAVIAFVVFRQKKQKRKREEEAAEARRIEQERLQQQREQEQQRRNQTQGTQTQAINDAGQTTPGVPGSTQGVATQGPTQAPGGSGGGGGGGFDPRRTQVSFGPEPVRQLRVEDGQQSQVHNLQGDTITIGRNPGNNILVPHPTVSGSHARLVRQGNAYVYEDLQSSNGTLYNGQRIQTLQLSPGTVLTLGEAKLTFL